jgi:hypothetical protein
MLVISPHFLSCFLLATMSSSSVCVHPPFGMEEEVDLESTVGCLLGFFVSGRNRRGMRREDVPVLLRLGVEMEGEDCFRFLSLSAGG